MALSEIRFEAPADSIGGALVVTPQGKVVGFLNATLRNEQLQNQTVQPIQAPQGQEGVAPMVKRAARAMANNLSQARFGPADMTVAYTTAPSSLQRALNSLLRGQDVIRPSIGVDVRNSQEGGALIESVDQGSEAEQAGLKKGDVVIEINGKRIQDQMDLAQAVMEQQPGATLVVKVKRGRALLTVPVRVGQKRSKTLASPGDAT
jgi:S1-C subfamily serine protease